MWLFFYMISFVKIFYTVHLIQSTVWTDQMWTINYLIATTPNQDYCYVYKCKLVYMFH